MLSAHEGGLVAQAARGDSTPDEGPAPLIVPGKEARPDTSAAARARRAREQFRLGQGLERQGMHEAAIVAYDLALRYDPLLPETHYRIGRLFAGRRQLADAARHFAAELRRDPRHVASDRELGLAQAQMGDTAQAVARLEGLTRARPEDDESWRALGFAYSTAGRGAQAEAVLRHAIALPPRRAAEHRDLGVLLASRGKIEAARREYRAALRLDDRDAATWFNLGNLEARAGRHEQAIAAYRGAEARDSTSALAIQGQLVALKALGREREVDDTYRRWLVVKPDDHNARLEAVRHFNARQRPDIALEIARNGLRASRSSADARLILGIAYQYAGQSRAALAELRRAQTQYAGGEGGAQVETLVATMRRTAPDSLRALFAADSVAAAARADSLSVRAREQDARRAARADSLRRLGRAKP